jgi:Predicted dehydrogenases and related proteins
MKKVRIACLGLGSRAKGLVEVYRNHEYVEFVAFCDIIKGNAENFAAYYNTKCGKDAKGFTDYETMAKESAYDALFIACDPDIQVDYACDAMNKGVHVMTEVPAAYTIDQCWNLVNTVKKTGCKYQLAEQTRYWNFIMKWREMSEKGQFGKIIYAEGEYLHYEPAWDFFENIHTGEKIWTGDMSYQSNSDYKMTWRGKLMSSPIYYLPHTLSPLLSITGGRIKKVSCVGTRPTSYVTEGLPARDIETALMYNSNDVVFSVRAGFTSPYGNKNGTHAHWYQIKGTERTVEWTRNTIDLPKMWTPDEGWTNQNWTLEDPNAEEYIKNSAHGGTDWYPIHYFVDAILNDKTPPMDVYKAVETAAPAILAAESANNGGILIEVPDFR